MTYPPQWGYPPPYPGPPARRRPMTVTVAGALMILGAVIGLIAAVCIFAAVTPILDEYRRRAVGTGASSQEIDDLATGLRGGLIGSGVLVLVLAVVVAVLAVLVWRGMNWARITTWVLIGLSLCCGLCGLVGSFGSAVGSVSTTSDQSTSDALAQALEDSIPGWFTAASVGLNGLQILGYIAVAILLALPASHAYFRKASPPQTWQPPMGPPPEGYPPHEGYPPPPPPQYPPTS